MDLRNAKAAPFSETEESKQQRQHAVEQKQLAIAEHQQWLKMPLTKTLVRMLKQHEDRIASSIGNAAMNRELNDSYVRLLAAKLNNTQTINQLINDSETFIAAQS